MISVIIPTYNREEVICRAVKSVLDQSGSNHKIEVIVVDDGSSDDTKKKVNGLSDSRIRYIRLEQNKGASAARNRGVDESQGEYLAFQDSDDMWLPGKLDRQMYQIQQSGADVVVCAFDRSDHEKRITRPQLPYTAQPGIVKFGCLLFENFISTQTILCKRACFDKIRFDESLPRFQDWDLALQMTRLFDVRYYDEIMVRQYIQADSISVNTQRGVVGLEKIFNKYEKEIKSNDAVFFHHLMMQQVLRRNCGMNCANLYTRELSWNNSWKKNASLMLEAANMFRIDVRRWITNTRR